VDGRPVARLVAEEVAGPLGLDAWIGVPDAVLPRVAELERAPTFQLAALIDNDEPDPRLALVYGNPPLLSRSWNDPQLLQAEIPGANGVASARAMARLYGCLASGGALDGVRLLEPAAVALGQQERSRGPDVLSGRPLRFGAGFELAGTPSQLGPADDAFGHTGAGGSSHGAWPGLRTGFSLVIAELRPEPTDERAPRLLQALHDAVVAAGAQRRA
jgi:CubicO group peptidase (beta-lactamase class C family)